MQHKQIDMFNTNSIINVTENKTKQNAFGISNWASKILQAVWTAGEILQALQCAFVQHTWRRVLRPKYFVIVRDTTGLALDWYHASISSNFNFQVVVWLIDVDVSTHFAARGKGHTSETPFTQTLSLH